MTVDSIPRPPGAGISVVGHDIINDITPDGVRLVEPPGSDKVQLELWRRIFASKCNQIKTLSPNNLQLFTSAIVVDIKESRFKHDAQKKSIDMMEGNYTIWVIMQHPPPTSITAQHVACHILALFYRSIDHRISKGERKYALDVLKRVFLSLEQAVKDQVMEKAVECLQASGEKLVDSTEESVNDNQSQQVQGNGKDGPKNDQGEDQNNRGTLPTAAIPTNDEDASKSKEVLPQNANNAQQKEVATVHKSSSQVSQKEAAFTNNVQKEPQPSASTKGSTSNSTVAASEQPNQRDDRSKTASTKQPAPSNVAIVHKPSEQTQEKSQKEKGPTPINVDIVHKPSEQPIPNKNKGKSLTTRGPTDSDVAVVHNPSESSVQRKGKSTSATTIREQMNKNAAIVHKPSESPLQSNSEADHDKDQKNKRSRNELAGSDEHSQQDSNNKTQSTGGSGGHGNEEVLANKRSRNEPPSSLRTDEPRRDNATATSEPGRPKLRSAGKTATPESTSAQMERPPSRNAEQETKEKGRVSKGSVPAPSTSSSQKDKGATDKSSSSSSPNTERRSPKKRQKLVETPKPPPPRVVIPALPAPLPSYCLQNLMFLPDNHSPSLASASLQPRMYSCNISYDAGFHPNGSGSSLDDKTYSEVRERLERYDPYWKIIKDLGSQNVSALGEGKRTVAWTRTSSCFSTARSPEPNNIPQSCASITVDMHRECINAKETHYNSPWGMKFGTPLSSYKTGDRRILLRMLPLERTAYDKKMSDTHRYPKGTFIQLARGSESHVIIVAQRRQQSHNAREWKGLCHPLDLTTFLKDGRLPFKIDLCAKEVVDGATNQNKFPLATPVSKEFEDDDGEMRPFAGTIMGYDAHYMLYKIEYEDGDVEELNYNEVASILVKEPKPTSLLGSYALHLAVCEYVSPDDLYKQLLGSIPRISLETSQAMAKKYLENQTVSLDSDDDEDDGNSRHKKGSLTFSLLCKLP